MKKTYWFLLNTVGLYLGFMFSGYLAFWLVKWISGLDYDEQVIFYANMIGYQLIQGAGFGLIWAAVVYVFGRKHFSLPPTWILWNLTPNAIGFLIQGLIFQFLYFQAVYWLGVTAHASFNYYPFGQTMYAVFTWPENFLLEIAFALLFSLISSALFGVFTGLIQGMALGFGRQDIWLWVRKITIGIAAVGMAGAIIFTIFFSNPSIQPENTRAMRAQWDTEARIIAAMLYGLAYTFATFPTMELYQKIRDQEEFEAVGDALQEPS